MTIGYLVNSSIGSAALLDAIIGENKLPKPLGVEITYVIVPPSPITLNFFGFSSVNSSGILQPAAPGISPFNSAGPGIDTTGTWLLNGTTMTVASVSGLAVGQLIQGTGLATATFITKITGSTVTFSPAAIAAKTSQAIVFTNYFANTP